MPKTKISEFSATPANNTDIDSINISEGCAPSGINDAIRELMAQLKDWQSGTSNDPYVVGSSGSLTLNQGTANGVAYLNGSKVVTSGSALTFDGTNLALTGTSPIYKVPTAGGSLFDAGGNNGIYILGSSNYVATFAGGSEVGRFTSTGLGIGTSSPVGKIHAVASSAGATSLLERSTASTAVPVFASRSLATSSGDMADGFGPTHAFAIQDTAAVINPISEIGAVREGADNSGGLVFRTYSAGTATTQMRLDKAGNLGLGVTPSAWGSPFSSVMQFTKGSIACQSNSVILFNNAYYDGSNYRYVNTAGAGYYEQTGGQHIWNRAASGTAGNAITFTQAMTLDADGDLGIGTTSPAYRLDVSGSVRLKTGATGTPVIVSTGGDTQGTLRFGSSGNEYSINSGADYLSMIFNTDGAERARIDSSGNLLVGTTSAPAKLSIAYTTTAVFGIDIKPSADSGAYAIYFRNAANSGVGSITTSASATSYNTSSDYRLKNTIAPMTGALAKVALLKPVTYKWNVDGSDGEGFIAHELAEVVPQCVTGEKDAVDENGNPKYQGIDTSFLVATLTAAIQELKAEFDAYKASHP